jgi:hypothetical protein
LKVAPSSPETIVIKPDSLKIVGIDEKRPPLIRKQPYIDIFFKLSHKAPREWCEIFNKLSKQLMPPARINKSDGVFIEAYVRDMNLLPEHLNKLKKKVIESNEQYSAVIRKRNEDLLSINASVGNEGGEQGRLNTIVAGLSFND